MEGETCNSPFDSKREVFLANSLYDCLEDNDVRHVMTVLQDNDADPNTLLPQHGFSPFHFIIGNESIEFAEEVTRLFIQHGGDPNVQSDEGTTPVHLAAAWGRTNLLHLLLVNGGNPWILDIQNKNAFHYAFEESQWDVVQLLHRFRQMDLSKIDTWTNPKFQLHLERVIVSSGDMCVVYGITADLKQTNCATTQTSIEDCHSVLPMQNQTNGFVKALQAESIPPQSNNVDVVKWKDLPAITDSKIYYSADMFLSTDESTNDPVANSIRNGLLPSKDKTADVLIADAPNQKGSVKPKIKNEISSICTEDILEHSFFDWESTEESTVSDVESGIEPLVDLSNSSEVYYNNKRLAEWLATHSFFMNNCSSVYYTCEDELSTDNIDIKQEHSLSASSHGNLCGIVSERSSCGNINTEQGNPRTVSGNTGSSDPYSTILDSKTSGNPCSRAVLGSKSSDKPCSTVVGSTSSGNIKTKQGNHHPVLKSKCSSKLLCSTALGSKYSGNIRTKQSNPHPVLESKSSSKLCSTALGSKSSGNIKTKQGNYHPVLESKSSSKLCSTALGSKSSGNIKTKQGNHYPVLESKSSSKLCSTALGSKSSGNIETKQGNHHPVLESKSSSKLCSTALGSTSSGNVKTKQSNHQSKSSIKLCSTALRSKSSDNIKTKQGNPPSTLSGSTGSGKTTMSISEEYKYTDDEEGIVLLERRLLVTPISISEFPELNNESGPDNLTDSYDTDALREELKARGYTPGPITATTKRVYRKQLIHSNPVAATDNRIYSPELERTLKEIEWQSFLAPCIKLEEEVSAQFSEPDSKRLWREGVVKSSFSYLLLDPRITNNLPSRANELSSVDIWTTFLASVFYIGKGKRSRPYSHLYQAVAVWTKSSGSNKDEKVQHIIDIWKAGLGVVCLHVFQNVIPAEAYTREAAMIDAVGLKNLRNSRHSEYYGKAATWNLRDKRLLGVYLLHRAMCIFLNEGERQLRPADIG